MHLTPYIRLPYLPDSIHKERIYKIDAVVGSIDDYWQRIAPNFCMFVDWEEHHKEILADSAVCKGKNVNQPRNLAKSVTVE